MSRKIFSLIIIATLSFTSLLFIAHFSIAAVIELDGKFYLIPHSQEFKNIDDDSDGYTENQGDCNDHNSTIFPGAIEKCSDRVDQDCDGNDTDCASLSLTTVENRLLELINIERNGAARPTLVRSPGLDRIISWHVYTMSEEKFLNHTDGNSRDGEARAKYYSGDSAIRCVELIQWWGGEPSGDVHYVRYKESPKHHSGYMEEGIYNLGPTTHVGVAVFSGTGPIGSQYESRDGSYSGVFLCDKSPDLVIDPYSEK